MMVRLESMQAYDPQEPPAHYCQKCGNIQLVPIESCKFFEWLRNKYRHVPPSKERFCRALNDYREYVKNDYQIPCPECV